MICCVSMKVPSKLLLLLCVSTRHEGRHTDTQLHCVPTFLRSRQYSPQALPSSSNPPGSQSSLDHHLDPAWSRNGLQNSRPHSGLNAQSGSSVEGGVEGRCNATRKSHWSGDTLLHTFSPTFKQVGITHICTWFCGRLVCSIEPPCPHHPSLIPQPNS